MKGFGFKIKKRMKSIFKNLLPLVFLGLTITNCEKIKQKPADILYKTVNKQFVLIRDVETLQGSNDVVSNHVDSILKGEINSTLISSGQKNFSLADIANDGPLDIGFEIINLNDFNLNNIPQSFDSLAARVIPINAEVLDNSTYKYPDGLNYNDEISESGNWTNQTSVLGTFLNAGNFQGNGAKYLGVRLPTNDGFNYGWIKIYCSQHNDTLKIIDFGVNQTANQKIKAGQVK